MTPTNRAIEFSKNGYFVFPIYKGKNGKTNKCYGWALNSVDPEHVDKVIAASNDPEFIKTWPELVAEKYNGAEVASFGILGINCVILDIDVKNGKDGMTQFLQLQSNHDILKPHMFTFTKSGGLHVFYKRPDKFKDAHIKTVAGASVQGIKYDAIDIRGNGGFVVGPDVITDVAKGELGKYVTVRLTHVDSLPEFNEKILIEWTRSNMTNDLDNLLFGADDLEQDYKSKIRRGIIPDFIPNGGRNEAFWLYANVSKSKGIPRDACRQMMIQMIKVVEHPETFSDSVDIEDILDRAYVLHEDNPYDVAVDIISKGLFQLTNYKSKLHYVILEDNPYLISRTPHDESTIKTLLTKFQKSVQSATGKPKIVNPMEVITKLIGDENRADSLGFKPGAGSVFTMGEDSGSKRFLNTFKPISIPKTPDGLDFTIWDEFTLLISRLFGPEGSDEWNLGLDFISWLIQKPEIKPSIAPFLISQHRGVGKSLLFNIIVKILGSSKDGESQARLTKLDEIQGRFYNPAGSILTLIDEVQFQTHKDSRKESVTFWRHLKNLITAETISVEIKGGATYQMPNSAAMILAANSGSHFPLEEFDRRLWIIDSGAQILERGTVDRLFQLVTRIGAGPDNLKCWINTLRYQLNHYKIKTDLSSLRAPLTAVKQEMFMNSLSDSEAWFVSHFEDSDNLFAKTPVISASAFNYVAMTSTMVQNSRYRDDLHGLFRDYKRRGYLRPIRTKSDMNQSRNLVVPKIGSNGEMLQDERREILYTTRDHGTFDNLDNTQIIQAFIRNAHTIKTYKGNIKKSIVKDLYEETAEAYDEKQ